MSKKKKKTQDKFSGYTYEQKKGILERIDKLEGLLRKLRNNVAHSDIDTHATYNDIFGIVEGLYGELDIHSLMLDAQRRWDAHKSELRRKGLTEL